MGRRIRRVVYSTTEYDYYYDDEWQLLEERRDGDTDPLNQYVWNPDYVDSLALQYYDASTGGTQVRHWYLQDANYNVTAIVNDSAAVLERYQYSPYGDVTFLEDDFDIAASAIGNVHLYTGRERDPETGLQLNRNRYYAAHLGRWVNRDPIGYEGSPWNLYEYIGSKPLSNADPFGLVACSPKADPDVMRVISAHEGKETLDDGEATKEATQPGADCAEAS